MSGSLLLIALPHLVCFHRCPWVSTGCQAFGTSGEKSAKGLLSGAVRQGWGLSGWWSVFTTVTHQQEITSKSEERETGAKGLCCRMEFMVNCLLARVVALTGPGASPQVGRWWGGHIGRAVHRVEASLGLLLNFPVLSRVSPGFRRGGEPLRPCGSISHLEPCYPSPAWTTLSVESRVAFVGSQLSLPFYSYREGIVKPQERERDRERNCLGRPSEIN